MLEHFLRHQVKVCPSANPKQRHTAERFGAVVRILKKNYLDIGVYSIGEIQIVAFIISLLPDGSYSVLGTKIIKT